MSLESERRANGAALEANRRAGGAAMEASRRAGGAALVAQRRGEQLQRDINSLGVRRVSQRTLRQVQPRGGIPGGMSTAFWSDHARAPSSGGGIASPLTETAYTDRQYHPDQTLLSTDGLLSFKVKPLKQLTQKDANDAEVVQIFAAPVTTP